MVAINQIRNEVRYEAKTEGVEQATAAVEGLAAATDKVAVSAEKQERKTISVSRAVADFTAKNDALFRAQMQVDRAQKLLNQAFEQGMSDTLVYSRLTAALAEKQAILARVTAQVAAANDNAAAKSRLGWTALSAQGAAQEKAFQSSERLAAGWRTLSAQGALQARALDNLKGANDNVATAFSAQAGQIGTLLPGYGKLIALVGGLGAAYAGNQFVQTVTQFQAIESGLKAATGSTEAAQSAMTFVRAESDRLGLSLGSTAKDFTSFAASTRGTALEGAKTRQVFSAIAEAGTVLGLSADDMSGALLALSQMASKGTVSSEELRGQLGERLPGAFNIAAKAMGVTTAELGKMLEQGQVLAADFLPRFAEEMHRVFGPEAAKAANNLQANINRLQTAILDLFLAAGKGGLTEALNDVTRQAAVFLRSSQDTAAGIGGTLASGLRTAAAAFQFLRQNSDLAGAALAALIALRYGPAVLDIAAGAARAAAMTGVYDVATRQLVVSQTAAIASSRALSVAMGAFGGPIGLALTAAAAGMAYLALRQDEGTKAAEAQAASLKTLDAALRASKGSLSGAADETKRLAAEQLAAAQAGVSAAQARLQAAEALRAQVRARAGGGGIDADFHDNLSTGVAEREAARASDDLAIAKERLAAVMRLLAGAATEADRSLLGLPPSIGAVTAAVDAAIPSMQRYGEALSKLIAMVPELAKAVEAEGKLTQARTLFDEGTLSARKAYLAGEISQNEMVDRVAKLTETYDRATKAVSGYDDAQTKVEARARAASIEAMDGRAGEIAKLTDAHDAFVRSLSEGEKASLTAARRNELVARSETVLAKEVANVNAKFDEREAKKAGASATRDAGKDAREAAREFADLEKQADDTFKKLFPEDALRQKGEELQKLLDKYRDRLSAADPRLVSAIETKIKLNLEGKDVEGVKSKTDDLAKEMSEAFRGVFDEMFSAGNKGFDGLLSSFTKSLSRIGTRALEQNILAPLLGGKEGATSAGGFDFGKIEKAVGEGSFSGIMESFGDLLKPGGAGGKGATGFASSRLGGGLVSAGVGASIGYQSQSPLMGALGGAASGYAMGGPVGGVIGGIAGLIGGFLGKSQAKKAAEKKIREQLDAYKDAYRQAQPEIEKLRAGFRGESVGTVGGAIDAAFQQAVQANATASKAGDQAGADRIMQDFVRYAERLRFRFIHAFEGTLSEVAAGFGTSGPFAQANAAIATLGESLKAFVADARKLPDAESNGARAQAAAREAALAALDPPAALSETRSRLAAIQGTAAGLAEVLRDLGLSADEAAAAIRDRTATAMEALRAGFAADLGAKINEASGKSYLNEVAGLMKERDALLADAQAIGVGTEQVSRYVGLAAQKIVSDSQLTGDAFTDLVERFPALRGQVVEFGKAVDTAAAQAEAAARALGYRDRTFAAGIDTGTEAGALAAFARKADQERAAEAKAGGQAMADLEAALAAERAGILRDFARQAAEAERTTAEATARRVLSAEDRLFSARNDTATLTGKLAEIDRRQARERLEEAEAGGQAMASLEQAQAAERLKIVREAAEAENAARKQALAEARSFLEGATKSIRTYLDGLKAGSDTVLSPGDRLKEAQAQFDRQIARARSGDREALGSITTSAGTLLEAGKGQYASGKGYQDIVTAVSKALEALPSQVSAEQLVVDAIDASKTAIVDATALMRETLRAAVTANNPGAVAGALTANFTRLDTSVNGLLDYGEFLAGLGPLATKTEQQAAKAIFSAIDADGDGQISRLEAVNASVGATRQAVDTNSIHVMNRSTQAGWQAEALRAAIAANNPGSVAAALDAQFVRLDTSVNGLLDFGEMVAALGPVATRAEQEAARRIFDQIDANGDGQISRLELVNASASATRGAVDATKGAVDATTRATWDVAGATNAVREFNAVYRNSFSYLLHLTERVVNNLWSANMRSGAQTFAEGGWVRGPGTGTSDSIAARLSNGEFVVNAAAARLNAPLLQAMNDNLGAVLPAMPVPVPVMAGGAGDGGAMLAELRALRAEIRESKQERRKEAEMQARITKAGADKVAGRVEAVGDEVAAQREEARRGAAPMRAGRGEPVTTRAA